MTESSEAEDFLKAYHARHPGCTPQAMADGSTAHGQSSYALLLSLVPAHPPDSVTVLDLACGDAFLLQKLLQRNQPRLNLIGVDMSEAELEKGRQRIGDHRVVFHQARAQSLPIPDASVDYVLCHMAIMLMDSVEEVIAEIRRVLKPGGIFSAVVGAEVPKAGKAAQDIFVRLLDEALQAEGKTWTLRLGDARLRNDGGIRSLFTRASGFSEPIQIEDHVLALNLSPSKATEFFMLTYDPELLSPGGLRKFEIDLRATLENVVDERGLIACPTGLKQFKCEALR